MNEEFLYPDAHKSKNFDVEMKEGQNKSPEELKKLRDERKKAAAAQKAAKKATNME